MSAPRAYYNEIDPHAAQWLRNLIAAGHIAPGDVDERSIADVSPDDLRGYRQCHFFAGIGVWSYALRRAGWSDDRPVWTGSAPCQPFSAAGRQAGFDDERHLWPALHWLIAQCRPPVVFGEQVASKIVDDWVDLVQADLEAVGYAFGCVPFPSAGVGAPHIRDRLYWMANSDNARLEGRRVVQRECASQLAAGPGSMVGGMADAGGERCSGLDVLLLGRGQDQAGSQAPGHGEVGGMADSIASGEGGALPPGGNQGGDAIEGAGSGRDGGGDADPGAAGPAGAAGPTNGFWRDADWLLCRDGKWRPVRPGSRVLADESTARMVRLRAYGNAINVEAAGAFIESAIGVIDK